MRAINIKENSMGKTYFCKYYLYLFLVLSLFISSCSSLQYKSTLNPHKYANFGVYSPNNEKAINEYHKLLETNHKHHKNLREVGRLYYLQEDYKSAEYYLQRSIEVKENCAIAWNNLGWVFESLFNYSKMRDSFEKSIKYDEQSPHNYIGLAGAYYYLRDYDKAKEIISKVLDFSDSNNSRAQSYLLLGKIYYKLNDKDNAIEFFDKHIVLHRNKERAFRAVGRYFYIVYELDLSEKYLLNSLKINEHAATTWNNLGWLYMKKEQYIKMSECFQKAISNNKNKKYAFDRIGLATSYLYLGNFLEAEKMFNQAALFVNDYYEQHDLNKFQILLELKNFNYKKIEQMWPSAPFLGFYSVNSGNYSEVKYLIKGHLAYLGGICVGDKIVSINDEHIINEESIRKIVANLKYSQIVKLDLIREGNQLTKFINLNYKHYLQPNVNVLNKFDITPPEIDLLKPAQSKNVLITTGDNKFLVGGKITDPSGIFRLMINGQNVIIDENGFFQKNIDLVYGNNSISIVAIDGFKNTSKRIVNIQRKSTEKKINFVKYHALLIAIDDYTYDNITDLNFPVNSAYSLKDYLTKHLGFADNIILLKDPSRKQIINELFELSINLGEDDSLLIFYSGHGHWDKKLEQGYWFASDSSFNDRSTWLSNGTIIDLIRGIKSKHTLLISDACFSASIFKRKTTQDLPIAIENIYKLTSRRAITSGAMEYVPDDKVFINYLIKGFNEFGDKYIDAQSLFTSIKKSIINNSLTHQTPTYGVIAFTGDEAGGDFIFSRH